MKKLLSAALAVLASGCVVVVQPTCNDGIQNGDETGVDCGGSCPNACVSCTDGIQNGSETGIDCGGSCPNACASCSDGVANGSETGIDCGGTCAFQCSPLTSMPNVSLNTYSSAGGVGLALSPGTMAGYAVTTNTGNSFRIVWNGDSSSTQYSHFWGSIWTQGTFTTFSPGASSNFPLDGNDFIDSAPYPVAGGERFDFDSLSSGTTIKGIDFTVDNTNAVVFDLYIDGVYDNSLVWYIDSSNTSVASNVASSPFGMIIQ